MQKKLLEVFYSIAMKYGVKILIVMAVSTVILGLFIPQLNISSSRKNLLPQNHPAQIRYNNFTKEFGSADNLIVVLEGDYKTLKSVVEFYADELKKEKKWVKSIFYKIDTSLFMKKMPLFVPLKDLQKGVKVLGKERNLLKKMASTPNLSGLMKNIESILKRPGMSVDPSIMIDIVDGINLFFTEWNKWVGDVSHNNIDDLNKLFGNSEAEYMIKSEGYLFSRDYKMVYLFVQPTSSSDEMKYLDPFISALRKRTNSLSTKYPQLKKNVKVSFTGMPYHVYTETKTVYSDLARAGSISVFLVIIILLIGFRSFKKIIVVLIPLGAGLILTLGLISATIGQLNLVSSSFLAVLFGIGIDFGIYLIRRTEEELGNGHTLDESIHKAVVVTGKGILTGGFTTGLAFYALMLSDFPGYAELGFTAGTGVFVVLFSTFLILPSIMKLIKIEPRQYDISSITESSRKGSRKKMIIAGLSVTVVFSCISIYGFMNSKLDYNALKLLPQNVESTIYQLKMEQFSDYKMSYAYITSKNFEDFQKKVIQIKKLKTVSRVDSLTEMIPPDQKKKIQIVNSVKGQIGAFRLNYRKGSENPAVYMESLKKLTDFFENAQEEAFTGKKQKLANSLTKLVDNLNKLNDKFEGSEKKLAVGRTIAYEKELFLRLKQGSTLAKDWFNLRQINLKTIPKEVVNRFKSQSGMYVAYISPTGSMWELDFLDKFVNDLKKIDKNVTGFPVTHKAFIRQAVNGIIQPILYSFLVVVLLLLIDFRSIKSALLAMVPLVIGMLWMQGALYFSNIQYNVASIAGLPLILGLGVVYGVHIVHRWRENPNESAFVAAQTTGRGVSFAAFTTISGLFSIVFAHHGGVSSFGIVLLYGIIICLFTALFILPSIIDIIYLKFDSGEKVNEKDK